MEQFFIETLGISKETYIYVVIPLFIFFARVTDVSINTMRIMMVMAGRRNIAPFLGFVEALIWLVAIGQIFQNMGHISSYFAYAGGFAMGTYVGMRIEERIAMGNVILRIITREPANDLIEKMKAVNMRFTAIDGSGSRGPVNLIFMVIKRQELPQRVKMIREFYPNAFYSVESVRMVSDQFMDGISERNLFSKFLRNRR
jgi:uncharacterized protein YebE (UPF0316 family)